jgi:putative nucleotidyltransferase with HDIG domain
VSGPEALAAILFILAATAVINVAILVDLVAGWASPAQLQAIAGTTVMITALTVAAMACLRHFHMALVRTWRQLSVLLGCCLACIVVARGLLELDRNIESAWQSLVYLTPLSVLSFFYTVVYGQRAAAVATAVLAAFVGLAVDASQVSGSSAQGLPVAVVLVGGGLVVVLGSARLRKRLKPLNVGILAGLAHALLVMGFLLLRGELYFEPLPPSEVFWGLANGVVVGIVVTVALPVVEWLFNVATDFRLLELSDQDQSLLRHLVALAPSTDNHSRRVALLAEAAAEAIGANSLLALVASYYHDIGKMVKPECFIENLAGGESPHDRLRPSMSSLIIAAHTKDGVELGREAGLPKVIIDIIAQHHGTSTITYFYHRYLEEAGDRPSLDATFFRYPGPKPQTREAAIVMLADSVEAASRTLSQPLPSRIETLVKRITTERLLDGQFEDSGLTLSELHRIERSFFRVLCAMYHARIDYPEAKPARTAEARA